MATALTNGMIIRTRHYSWFPTKTQLGINIRYWTVGGVVGGGITGKDVADQLGAAVGPLYNATQSADTGYYGTGCQIVGPPDGVNELSAMGAGPGTFAGQILPSQVSGIITVRSAFAVRKFRGRIYLPFPATTAESISEPPTAAYQIAGQFVANKFSVPFSAISGLNVATLTPVIWHKGLSAPTPVTGCAIRGKWATQRRRGDYGRLNQPPF